MVAVVVVVVVVVGILELVVVVPACNIYVVIYFKLRVEMTRKSLVEIFNGLLKVVKRWIILTRANNWRNQSDYSLLGVVVVVPLVVFVVDGTSALVVDVSTNNFVIYCCHKATN